MRKNLNTCHIEGYLYDISKLKKKVSGEQSKNPGTEFFTGDINIAVDEEGLNVVPVHFSYVTAVYSKSGKENKTFTALDKIYTNKSKTWLESGKDEAFKVKIDGNLALNDFFADDGSRVSARRCDGSFLNIVTSLCDVSERNTYQADIVITKVVHVDANPDKNIDKDFTSLNGICFNYRNDLLPMSFSVHNDGGMKYFEGKEPTEKDPLYTKIWGHINNKTIKIEKTEESAFGEASVTTYENKSHEWVVTGTAKVPYDYGDEEVLTPDDLNKGMQNREVLWAEIKKRNDEYLASKNANNAPKVAAAAAVKTGGFSF